MKPLLLIVIVINFFVFFEKAYSKQNSPANPRIVSQEDGRRAGDISNMPEDVQVTQKIRQELMRDTNLSTKAKNVTILVADKGVTIKGVVESNNEMERVLKHAYISAPKYKIYNQISVLK